MPYILIASCALMLYPLVHGYRMEKKRRAGLKKMDGASSRVANFSQTVSFYDHVFNDAMLIDDDSKQLCLLRDAKTNSHHQIIPYAAVLSVSIVEDGQTVMYMARQDFNQQQDMSMASMGKQRIKKLVLKLVFESQQSPATFDLVLLDKKRAIYKMVSDYRWAQEQAYDWQKYMSVIVAKANQAVLAKNNP